MRIAIVSDIHGNLPALEAVLFWLEHDPPDAVVVGGDVCAGPMPVEVLTRLRELPWPVHWLRGNADRAVVMGFDGTIPPELQDHALVQGDAWAATFLSREQRDFIDSFPALVALEVVGLGDVLFCHATAHSDEARVTVFTPPDRLARILDEAGAELLGCGHTHRQFDRTVDGRRMVNAGSIGRPYEHEPGAYWLRLGPDFRLIRTPYDVAGAAAAFHASGYPAADLIFDVGDADGRARHYERAAEQPVAAASLIDPAENPLARRVS